MPKSKSLREERMGDFSTLADFLMDKERIKENVQQQKKSTELQFYYSLMNGLNRMLEAGEIKPETFVSDVIKKLQEQLEKP